MIFNVLLYEGEGVHFNRKLTDSIPELLYSGKLTLHLMYISTPGNQCPCTFLQAICLAQAQVGSSKRAFWTPEQSNKSFFSSVIAISILTYKNNEDILKEISGQFVQRMTLKTSKFWSGDKSCWIPCAENLDLFCLLIG